MPGRFHEVLQNHAVCECLPFDVALRVCVFSVYVRMKHRGVSKERMGEVVEKEVDIEKAWDKREREREKK